MTSSVTALAVDRGLDLFPWELISPLNPLIMQSVVAAACTVGYFIIY